MHPVVHAHHAVLVELGLALLHVDLDEMASVLTADAWMRISWIDEHLNWSGLDNISVSNLHFAQDELWRPDIKLYNSADDPRKAPYGETTLLVEREGRVLWVPPARLKAFCKIDLRFWPFDRQECKLKFGSWTSHGQQLDLGLYRNLTHVENLQFYTNNREWKVLTSHAATSNLTYDCCQEPYPDVTFVLDLVRDSPGYRSVIVLPCLVIMLMTICCFLLPPTAGEKVVINGFAFLASIAYLVYFASTLPFHTSDVPIIVMFYSNTTALIGIGLLLNVTCISMARERKYSGPPKFLKMLFSGSVGKCLCLGHYYHQVSATHQRLFLELTDMAESEQQDSMDESSQQQQQQQQQHQQGSVFNHAQGDHGQSLIMKDWLLVAAGLERFFFILYTVIFAIVTSVYV